MPNPWDAGSARILASQGFSALGTTSAGLAISLGLPDGRAAIARDAALTNVRQIANATDLPVSADFESGYAKSPEEVFESVTLAIETGVAGLSIEDATYDPTSPLQDVDHAVERLRAAREAIDRSGVPIVLTGRCEAFLVGLSSPLDIAIPRLNRFHEAGADCLYAPAMRSIDDIRTLLREVPRPVNVVVPPVDSPAPITDLLDLGVSRLSFGGALACVAYGNVQHCGEAIVGRGDLSAKGNAASFHDLNEFFANRLDGA